MTRRREGSRIRHALRGGVALAWVACAASAAAQSHGSSGPPPVSCVGRSRLVAVERIRFETQPASGDALPVELRVGLHCRLLKPTSLSRELIFERNDGFLNQIHERLYRSRYRSTREDPPVSADLILRGTFLDADLQLCMRAVTDAPEYLRGLDKRKEAQLLGAKIRSHLRIRWELIDARTGVQRHRVETDVSLERSNDRGEDATLVSAVRAGLLETLDRFLSNSGSAALLCPTQR